MTGCRCTVATCTNSLEKTKKKGNVVQYHNFPKDVNIRDIWVQYSGRVGKWNPKSCRICSDHFTQEDYEEDKIAKMLNLKPKRRFLKKSGKQIK